eukprot:gnl/MRDRNA2_/MRDRNA2_114417_c0_seq1.p1 gnl/MRDRNA2_/MRDRNA2_114417_c0~~gnl/MRDRNA2_/MRDRNA2_114417_c0_seq1.p1  ORF type:complete len:516 (-),score=151.68 gnl/MRDRNA2_/MRDRNA2_114417_c0_seq1:171-1547(-)
MEQALKKMISSLSQVAEIVSADGHVEPARKEGEDELVHDVEAYMQSLKKEQRMGTGIDGFDESHEISQEVGPAGMVEIGHKKRNRAGQTGDVDDLLEEPETQADTSESSDLVSEDKAGRRKVKRSKKKRAGSQEEDWVPTAESSHKAISLAESSVNQTEAARKKYCPDSAISARFKTEVLRCTISEFLGVDTDGKPNSSPDMWASESTKQMMQDLGGEIHAHGLSSKTLQQQNVAVSRQGSLQQQQERSAGSFMKKVDKVVVPPNAQAFRTMVNEESLKDADAYTGEQSSIKRVLVQAMESEDIAVLVDVIQGELNSRGEGDVDVELAKSVAAAHKTPEDNRSDDIMSKLLGGQNRIAVLVGMTVALVLLFVCIVGAFTRPDPTAKFRKLNKSLSLDSSDIESSEGGTTDKELRKRMERFEQRLEEHTRMLEAEEEEMRNSKTAEDVLPTALARTSRK